MSTPLKRFTARSAGGVPYPLRLFPVVDPNKPFAHAFTLPDGMLVYLETDSGRPVRRVAQGSYERLDLPGFILSSDDPDAP